MIDRKEIRMPEGVPPRLIVVVDTEEEYDWNQTFNRQAIEVRALRRVARAQKLFEAYQLRPVYVVDYPVASQERGYSQLKGFTEAGKALVGAHLHPWVSPPHEEDITAKNSFPGNLPRRLEAAKLITLTETIESSFGQRPTIYKAGRFGIGSNTPSILAELGYTVDISAAPPFDYRVHMGPDFSGFSNHPYLCGPDQNILGLPNTGAYVGYAGRMSRELFDVASHPVLRWTRLPKLLAKVGAVNCIRLSPEGFSLAEMTLITEVLYQQGVRVFVMSFHSTSLKPGCTPHVGTDDELHHFLDRIKNYLEFFLKEFGGVASTPPEVRQDIERINRKQTA
ncbi:MAG: polysaccharide deacetylase family protein [Magnetococcales bacterium]|nr:polysaccharide deacetylase family protein [Magnetococcales bacterium]